MSYDSLFANPVGRTPRSAFIPALIVLILVVLFYQFLARAGRNGDWVLVTLLYPAFVLHARRLHDMGLTAWLAAIPLVLLLAAFGLKLFGKDIQTPFPVMPAALAVGAAFSLWGLVGKSKA